MSALLDRLLAKPQTDMIGSIGEHLHRFFNTRQGSLVHLPAYGLPDINNVYQGLPYSLEEFTRTLKSQIVQYEPRVKEVKVGYQSLLNLDTIVIFEIIATLHSNDKVIFNTWFMPGGQVIVK